MSEKKTREEKRALEAWRPFGELEPWPRLLGDWPFPGRLSRWMEDLYREGPSRSGPFLPAIDVSDDDQHYAISVEVPGASKDDIHVELQEGMLTIRGEKKVEREEKKEQRRYVERSYGSFSRSLRLPPDADADRLEASFKDGVLRLTIPKTEEAKPRTIAIR
jgi:HSP20 family protein